MQNKINELKSSVGSLIDTMIASSNSLEGVTIKNDIFSVQLGSTSSDNKKVLDEAARENNLSVLNFTKCEEELKLYYDLPKNMSLLMRKIDFDSLTNLNNLKDSNASNSVTFSFYHPESKQKLNSSICDDVPVSVSLPLKNPTRLNMALYLSLSSSGLDGFDPNSTAFSSRCFPLSDNSSNADTSVNFRRNNYFQGTAECGEGCTYQGLSEDNYMDCNCTGIGDSEIANTIVGEVLADFPTMNIDIAKCYNLLFVVFNNIYI